MTAFLVTFKPASETPERGWPLEELQKLVQRRRAGENVIEPWRFHNRRAAAIGDRVFVLLQGKMGPAIIGYGEIAGRPQIIHDQWYVPIQFESLTDPIIEVFLDKMDLLALEGGQRFWSARASGVQLNTSLAAQLERLVIGKPSKPRAEGSTVNPDWTRDELILALDFYLAHRPNPPGKESLEIRNLSALLNRLGERLFRRDERANTFRNESGLYMKLMNFRRFDPEYVTDGKKGLVRGAKADEEVWAEFAGNPDHCRDVARAIVTSLDDPELTADSAEIEIDEGTRDAPEGKILTRIHFVRERSRRLVEQKRKRAMKRHGKLECEVCGFDFAVRYGDRGSGFIECHHTKPVETLSDGHRTRLEDLALICANCHRMIHRQRPWLSVTGLRTLLREARG